MKRTGGDWSPDEKNIFFIAGDAEVFVEGAPLNDHLLIPVNAMKAASSLDSMRSWIAKGKSVLLDSGVFNLTMEHVRAHGVRMDEALSLAPDEIDGFDGLFELYCKVIASLGAESWGYIEIDQGGRENKIKTRAKLEKMGFNPIPVYHPLNDGPDYFDELAQNYDRICLGNIVQADGSMRKRLLSDIWERRRKYPNLWVHVLGLTPSQLQNAYPIDSADSSSWLAPVRYGAGSAKDRIALSGYSHLPRGFTYDYAADAEHPTGYLKARSLGAYLARFVGLNWRGLLSEYSGLGLDPDLYIEGKKNV